MKQFNLEEYLANPSRKVVTREGRPVRILCTDLDDESYPVVAAIGNVNCDKFTSNGLYQLGRGTKYDLFFAPEKHEGWVNVYKSGINWSLGASIWQTEEEAKKWVGAADYATTIKIEWEE